MNSEILLEAEAALFLRCSVHTLRRLSIPKFYLYPKTKRCKRYRAADYRPT